MIVAYDLRYAADHFTGIGTHAYALLEALLELPGDERYAVLWHPRLRNRRYDVRALASHPRVHWHERAIDPIQPWGVLQVGAWVRSVRADVYLSPFYLRPVGSGCPSLLTIHDVWPLRLPEGLSWLKGQLYRASLMHARGARFIVTSSQFSQREIASLLRLPADRVRAIRLGVPPPTAEAEPRRPARLPEGPFALVVGDNRPRKNLEVLARAWAGFGASPPLGLVAAGPVDDRFPSLAQLARSSGAHGVTELGWVEEPELAWLYRNATAVLFPSRYEGFGFPLVEAFVRGTPAVAADIPVLHEIGDGVARFVDPDRPDAWMQEVGRLASDPQERSRLAEIGRNRARELPYRGTAERTLALLREAAGCR